MYTILVRPMLEYGAQALSFNYYNLSNKASRPKNLDKPLGMLLKLEQFQNWVLKTLIPCPKSAPPALIRLLTGVVPFSARADMLKLRYFWTNYHRIDRLSNHKQHCIKKSLPGTDKLSSQILRYKRSHFLQSNIGYIHEVFNICCKYNYINGWHGICKDKTNPLTEIKRVVEKCCFHKDLEIGIKSDCMYSSLFLRRSQTSNNKGYKIEPLFNILGLFPSAKGRSLFLFALLDNCKYHRTCPMCKASEKDIIHHALSACHIAKPHKKTLLMQYKLYGAQFTNNLDDKEEIFSLAINGSRALLKALCEFLLQIGYYYTKNN